MKKFTVSYFFVCLHFLTLFAACDKAGYKELQGTWIEELERGGDDEPSYVLYQKFKFDKDKVTLTMISEVEGEVMQAVTCLGEWKFFDEKYIDDKKAKGVIEIEYDLSSLRVQDNLEDVVEFREKMIDYFKSNNEILEKAHEKNKLYGMIITDIKKNVITLFNPGKGSYQWVREDYYEENVMEKEAEERSERNIEFEEDNNYESENEVKTKKSGPSPLFLEHVVIDYYECVFEDDEKIFYLTFFQETGRGAFQTSSGQVYLLSITHQNDTGDKLECSVETLNEKRTNMEFDIDITFYPDISGKMIEGGSVYDFTGNAYPDEMP